MNQFKRSDSQRIHNQPQRFSSAGTSGVAAMDQSDFSPLFWLAGDLPRPTIRRGPTFAGIPLSYPVLAGLFLFFIVLMQRESFTFM
jgi:hypothetical protein